VHSPLIVDIAGIHKCLQMLDIMVVAYEFELDAIEGSIGVVQILELEVDIGSQADLVELEWKIVVLGDTQEGLHGRKGRDIVNHSIHAG
jgi:hypothetical protein